MERVIMAHLFISPHLDDAILSCGGTIAALTRQGEYVLILTTMAGEPPENLPSTPFIETIRKRWSSGREHIRARRLEDGRAAQVLGAQVYHLPIFECVFRTARDGQGNRVPLYGDANSPYETICPDDDAPIALMECKCPLAEVSMIYAPLCADNHVDHRIACNWALALTRGGRATPLRLYEEYPAAALNDFAKARRALRYYRELQPPYTLTESLFQVSAPDAAAKVRALKAYASHIRVLWRDEAAMDSAVRAYMSATGGGTLAERYWNIRI
jgi:LmbE family N-acetylglucosaminyl deacetylase